MKILIDMNLSPRWANLLVNAGIEAAHWSTLGAANAPDVEIVAFARSNNYVVLTHDLDFGAILSWRSRRVTNPAWYKSAPMISAWMLSGSRLSMPYGK